MQLCFKPLPFVQHGESLKKNLVVNLTSSIVEGSNPTLVYNNFKVNPMFQSGGVPDSMTRVYYYSFGQTSGLSSMTITIDQILPKPTILVISGNLERLNLKIQISTQYDTVKSAVIENLKSIVVNTRLKSSVIFSDTQVQSVVSIKNYCDESDCELNAGFVQYDKSWSWDNGGQLLEATIRDRIGGYNYTAFMGCERGVGMNIINTANNCNQANTNTILAIVLPIVITCCCCSCLCSLFCGVLKFFLNNK